tara:strand:+ start:157 stop:327 length:171 start_codon:yes stop_codon:yes gene_type:complete
MKINLPKLKNELRKHSEEHEKVLLKYLVLYLLRDYFTTNVLKEIAEQAQDFLQERN